MNENPLKLDAPTHDRALACVHCGLCLPACPTYLQTGHEADGPRGRIELIRGLSDGQINPTATVVAHLDSCLDCRSCETACPSGVVYHELIEGMRTRLVERGLRRRMSRFTLAVLTRPFLLKLAMIPARLARRLGIARRLSRLTPAGGPWWPRTMPRHMGEKNQGDQVGYFTGCVGAVAGESVNRQSVELLAAGGLRVWAPATQRCCGAIHHHNGDHHAAEDLARRNIDAFSVLSPSPGTPGEGWGGGFPRGQPPPLPSPGVPEEGKYIIASVAGCGAMLRDYGLLLRDDPKYADRAREFSARVRDISEVLDGLELPPPKAISISAVYADACHLLHGQKVSVEPRRLLRKIPGLKLVDVRDSDQCCGAAGTYSITHPEMADALADKKLDRLAETGADIIVTGNIGCALHLAARARERGRPVRIVHPVQLLHEAIFGKRS